MQDRIGPVGEDHGDDVEVLARLRPQALDGVHARAVGLHADDLAVGAGHRRADAHRDAFADRAPGELEIVVLRRVVALLVEDAARRDRLVADDRVLGQKARHDGADLVGVEGAGGQRRLGLRLGDKGGLDLGGARLFRQRIERADEVVAHLAERGHGAAVMDEAAGLARIGEEADRDLRADQHQQVDVLQLLQRHVDGVEHLGDRDAPGATLDPPVRHLPVHLATGRRADARRRFQRPGAQGRARHHQCRA